MILSHVYRTRELLIPVSTTRTFYSHFKRKKTLKLRHILGVAGVKVWPLIYWPIYLSWHLSHQCFRCEGHQQTVTRQQPRADLSRICRKGLYRGCELLKFYYTFLYLLWYADNKLINWLLWTQTYIVRLKENW